MDLRDVSIDSGFWKEYISLVKDVVIPYQHEILYDRVPGAEPSYAVHNFSVAAGKAEGKHGGYVFQDSDTAKWLEAVGYSLAVQPDPELEELADRMIDRIVAAQQPDGYLNTYYIINGLDKRFTNLGDCHELYCLGHFIEAAVAYYDATGKRKLLDAMCRFADLVDQTFGPEEGKINGYPGHEEIELALVKLYETTGEERYLRLGAYFINQRGAQPHFFTKEWERRGKTSIWSKGQSAPPDPRYNQSHLPVREQKEAVGHAVRAVYLYTGAARVAAKTGDEGLIAACRALWENITKKQMYITGSIGQTSIGEAFTFDYDLPNDTVYAETCAAIGLIFFAQSMMELEPKAVYADVIERALYNTVLAGMAKDGKHYFYVNPLEAWPEASGKAPILRHVKPERPGWYACACCPPNVARLLSSLGKYIYLQRGETLYVNQYIGGRISLNMGGCAMVLRQRTNYPWDGDVAISGETGSPHTIGVAPRLAGWCGAPEIRVNGKEAGSVAVRDGYMRLTREWENGDQISLHLIMDVRFMRASPKVRADAGKVAVTRGPLVYCMEEADNGGNLSAFSVNPGSVAEAVFRDDLLGGAVAVKVRGYRELSSGDALYYPAELAEKKSVALQFIPYYLWSNREVGEMAVWVTEARGNAGARSPQP